MEKSTTSKNNVVIAAADFDRPLLLTPSQDSIGWLLSHAGRALLFVITFTSVISVLLIFFFIAREAFPFLAQSTVAETLARIKEFFTSTRWYPSAGQAEFGALALIIGSFYVTVGALLFAVPTGLLAAMFLSDIAPFHLRQICKPVIELLAAIPSVAYGFFAVLVVAPWLQSRFGFSTGTNALNASIMLAIMAIPTIVSVADDAMTATGRQIREASYALGATRAETLIKVVMPAAHSGIIAASILGMMRAIGETMVVWMAAGNACQIPTPWWNLGSAVRTMTATIAGDMGETVKGSDHYRALFMVGLTLLAFTFVLNLTSEYFLTQAKKIGGGKRK
jgi:phosphate transport system permease protein